MKDQPLCNNYHHHGLSAINTTIAVDAVKEADNSNVIVGNESFCLVNCGQSLGGGTRLLLQPGDNSVSCAACQEWDENLIK